MQGLISAANLAVSERCLLKRREGDLGEVLDVVERVKAKGESIADIKGFNEAIEEVKEGAIEGRLGELGEVWVGEEEGFELSLDA